MKELTDFDFASAFEIYTEADIQALLDIYSKHRPGLPVKKENCSVPLIQNPLFAYFLDKACEDGNDFSERNSDLQKYISSLIRKADAMTESLHGFLEENNRDLSYATINALSFKRTDKPVHDLSAEERKLVVDDFLRDLPMLSHGLRKFAEKLRFMSKKGYLYPGRKNDPRGPKPETLLVQRLSENLTEMFQAGGHTRTEYEGKKRDTGWRIECLEYLIKKASIKMTAKQISDAVNNS